MSARRQRRGNQAIEFALTLPVLAILASGVIDLGQYLTLADSLADAVAQGAVQGAMADQNDGESPTALAEARAANAWTATELPGTLTVTAALSGAAPDQRIVVTGSVPFTSWFGFVTLPVTITNTHTVRLMYQPDP